MTTEFTLVAHGRQVNRTGGPLWFAPQGHRTPAILNEQTRHVCGNCGRLLRRGEWTAGIFRTAPPGRPGAWGVLCGTCRPLVDGSPHPAGLVRAARDLFGLPVSTTRRELVHAMPGTSIESIADRWAAR
jgi:hypothetical protein